MYEENHSICFLLENDFFFLNWVWSSTNTDTCAQVGIRNYYSTLTSMMASCASLSLSCWFPTSRCRLFFARMIFRFYFTRTNIIQMRMSVWRNHIASFRFYRGMNFILQMNTNILISSRERKTQRLISAVNLPWHFTFKQCPPKIMWRGIEVSTPTGEDEDSKSFDRLRIQALLRDVLSKSPC